VYAQTSYQAARAAVLGPLIAHYRTKELADCYAVRALWRKRVTVLTKAGYAALTEPNLGLKVRYLRNCPPFGVETEDYARPCHRYLACPWCWGRSVALDAFQHLERLLYASYKEVDPPGGVRLVAFVTTHVRERLKPVDRQQWMEELFALFAEGGRARRIVTGMRIRSVEREALAADASYIAHRIGFAKEGQRVEMERCGLVLTREEVAEDAYKRRVAADLKGHDYSVRPHAVRVYDLGPPTRRALWQGVRKALSYPRSMLYHDPLLVAAVLNGLLSKKANLTARQGPRTREAFWKSLGLAVPSTFRDEGVPDDD
jgi:hypothetical protein